MTARVLVTGYGGFLGAAICRQLLQLGFAVRGLARSVYAELQELGVEAVQGNVSSNECCQAACKDCDAVIHTAAKAGVWGSWQEYYEINTAATDRLLAAATKAGVKAFVHTSSPSVTFGGQHQSGVDETVQYPTNWLCHYPHTKALAEQSVLAEASKGSILACALRPHLIWGLNDPHLFPRVVERTKSGRLRRVGSGTNLIDVAHVDNAALSHVLAVQQLLAGNEQVNGQAFFITDGEPVECWQWISRIIETAGLKVPEKSISFGAAYRIGAILETIYKLMSRKTEPPMTRFVAAQLALDHYFSIEKARRLLGYQPAVDIDAEFHRCSSWLRSL
ncbi:MAG: NAD-dependent epimerase/dehydratase family protein [Pirellulales bacterium]